MNVFTICSLFYIGLLCIIYYTKKRIKTIENTLFKYIMITNLVGVLLAIFSYFTILHSDVFGILNTIVSKAYIIYLLTWLTTFAIYIFIISIKKEDKTLYEKEKNNIFLIFGIMYIIFLGLILINPLYYNTVKDEIYSYGPAANIMYVVSGIYIFIWTVRLLFNIKEIKNKKYLPIFAFMLLGLLVMIVQKMHPELLLMTSMETFIVFLMYFTIENPDMKLLNELHESKEISDSANDEKTTFIYNMTQESRKVTNDINEKINKLLDCNNKDEIKDYARDILNLTAKYSNITYDILGVPGDTTVNFKLYKEKYSIKNLLKEIVSLNSRKCQEKGLLLRINIDNNLPDKLYGDSIKLKENINKLIEISLENTSNGFIELSVGSIIKDDICRLFITIEDSGNGYKGEELNKILSSNKDIAGINKNIIKMNGALSITSSFGIGSKVKIILDQKIEKVEKELNKYESIINNINILLIDDSSATPKIIEKLLKGHNCKVDYVSDYKDAIELIKNGNKYQIILLDEEIKNMTGEEILLKLKQVRNFNFKVVLLTKDNNYEYNESYLKKGFSNYLLKPLNRNDLMKVINE